jgi:hypothetical protein
MGPGVGAGVRKPAVNEPAGCWIERCGLWGFDDGGQRGCVPTEGPAGTIIAFFPAGVAILAACKLVEAADMGSAYGRHGILSERSGGR